VCFELRFPEVFRIHGARGAELVIVPAAWYRGDGKEEALRVLAQARAHENGYYVAVSAHYGSRFTGRSIVVNPLGLVEVDAGWGDRYVEHQLDKSMVEEARRLYPLLELRRTDLYSRHLNLLTGLFQ
jgi:predicted amidohydrolase